jgi:hypothetical protein
MIGVACFVALALLLAAAPIVVLLGLDRRDQRRRRERLAQWYVDHGGGE